MLIVFYLSFSRLHLTCCNPFSTGYNDWSRIILALPLMRAFSTIRLLRDVVMGMITVIPSYVHVFTLLVIAFYFYSALGCLLFAR